MKYNGHLLATFTPDELHPKNIRLFERLLEKSGRLDGMHWLVKRHFCLALAEYLQNEGPRGNYPLMYWCYESDFDYVSNLFVTNLTQ